MLINKELQGDAGLPEHTALKGLLDVGVEYMTSRDHVSEVQVAGQFATMRRRGGEFLQLATLFEPPDARRLDAGDKVVALGDDEEPPPLDDPTGIARTRLLSAMRDEQEGPLPFRAARSELQSRLPRFTELDERIEDVDHSTKKGKRRFFSLGDGRALLVRELSDPADTRFFMGVDKSYRSRRRRRVTGVELVPVDIETGAQRGEPLLSFSVHSGLGFDPGARAVTFTLASDVLFDNSFVYASRAGAMWGRLFGSFRGDPSATYSVAEPAWAKEGEDSYLSLVVVHGLPEDSYDLQSSALYRLTCTRTTPNGVATSKITLPPVTNQGNHFYSAIEMDMVRLGPSTVLVNVLMASQHLPGTPDGLVLRARAFFWSDDNGATWSIVDTTPLADANAAPSISGFMAKDHSTALVFSDYQLDMTLTGDEAEAVAVYEMRRSGVTRIGTIAGSQFSAGLQEGVLIGGKRVYPPYLTTGYGGGLRARDKNLLWMQFDPRWINPSTTPVVLSYPGSRAMLMVSEDGGATWARQLLPQPWPQRVGFVVSLDTGRLAIPVYESRRTEEGLLKPLGVTIYTSTNAVKWSSTTWRLRLPSFTWVDGRRIQGTPAYDIDDVRHDLNRGELFPLVSIRDDQGELLPMNPGRPWIADHRKTGPTYG